jgi:hypothetical protein
MSKGDAFFARLSALSTQSSDTLDVAAQRRSLLTFFTGYASHDTKPLALKALITTSDHGCSERQELCFSRTSSTIVRLILSIAAA